MGKVNGSMFTKDAHEVVRGHEAVVILAVAENSVDLPLYACSPAAMHAHNRPILNITKDRCSLTS